MKIAKENSKIEIALRKAEQILLDAGISIEYNGFGRLRVTTKNNQKFELIDIETGEGVSWFPRMFDSEKLKLVE